MPPSPEDLPAAMVARGGRVLGFFRSASPAELPCSSTRVALSGLKEF